MFVVDLLVIGNLSEDQSVSRGHLLQCGEVNQMIVDLEIIGQRQLKPTAEERRRSHDSIVREVNTNKIIADPSKSSNQELTTVLTWSLLNVECCSI